MQTNTTTPREISQAEQHQVAGGERLNPSKISDKLKPVRPPVYYTLAIGENGGDLPETITF